LLFTFNRKQNHFHFVEDFKNQACYSVSFVVAGMDGFPISATFLALD
jgi:hypothetical protein